MCKLFGIVEIESQKNAEFFTKKAIPLITKTDNHGLGIMRLGENGVHIQRWLEVPAIVRRKQSPALAKYEKALKHQQNEAGRPSKGLYAIAVHGRFATCERSLKNTHPFYRAGTALMHNGVIPNSLEFTRVVSTCDSEALLSQYVEHNVKKDPEYLTDALTGVQGYYAAIVFNDNGTIDIWRDDTASLFIAHVKGVGVVFATTAEIIIGAARKCKAFVSGLDEILPYTAIRWNKGRSPEITTFESVTPYVPPIAQTFDIQKPDEINDGEKWWHTDRVDEFAGAHSDRELTEEEIKDQADLEHLRGYKDVTP